MHASDQRAQAALQRLDRAVARIEAAATGDSDRRQELERLRTAHDQLRRKVSAAIGQIDALLGPGESG